MIASSRHDDTSSVPEPQPFLDGVDLHALAERLGTPLHAYSANAIRRRIGELQTALQGLDATICYAVKANSNRAILELMAAAGLGADIVSAGELQRALAAGIPAARIVFSGVGKTDEEIGAALDAGIARFNVESLDELHAIERVAAARHVVANAAVRINPDVDALTHAKISTGRAENKFGVSIAEARRWFAEGRQLAHVRLDGLHVHIGSQILDLTPFRLALHRVAAFWRELVQAGHPVASIDVGGGLGVRYRAGQDQPVAAADYVQVVREALAGFDGRLLLEPGRYLVAEAGVLLTRVLRIKEGTERSFLVLDAAMNDLQRPSLYDAWHDIVPVSPEPRPLATYDVVGPVCETGDTFARGRVLPACAPGDLLAIQGTGAYGASMASTYNSRPLAAEALLDDGRYAVIRRRQTLEEMVAGEQPAQDWLAP
ncbi:diaminopimelate decarboxylase [Frateuria sp. STR12]|uniref:diaminopimelate decarboxylase n=1 Tax=Frateuria hangzhouensis TaxID=2995589 RepID=UPI002260C8B1|nr:diaminopimelate decarboxylase [Frateuria sp. STR12]MCX7512824.1 diaminopimelate decarboxylase [Frateuria sp. STR12]